MKVNEYSFYYLILVGKSFWLELLWHVFKDAQWSSSEDEDNITENPLNADLQQLHLSDDGNSVMVVDGDKSEGFIFDFWLELKIVSDMSDDVNHVMDVDGDKKKGIIFFFF